MPDNKSEVKIRPREEDLHKKWMGKADYIPVNNQQYSFDSLERQEGFVKALFETEKELERYRHYRSEWYRRSKEFDPGRAPLAVCCELVSMCNLNCPMCYSVTEEFQASVVGVQRQMPWNIVRSIIDECAVLDVPSVLFSWRGESTLYRAKDENGQAVTFADVLAYARKKGILEITSLTNGQMIDEDLAGAIVDAEPSWISVSIDGLEDNYNKIRAPKHKQRKDHNAFQEVTGNIERMIRLRNARGKTRPQIRSNSIYPPIADDPMAYYRYMQNIGVGWVTVNEMLDFRGASLPEDRILKDWACQYPFQRLTISANGSMLPCTGAHNEEEEVLLGRYPGSRIKEVVRNGKPGFVTLPERTIKDVWHCAELENIRALHKEKMRCKIPACRNCRHGAVKHGVEWVPEDWDMKTMEWKGHLWKE